jgi:hypothetical protein
VAVLCAAWGEYRSLSAVNAFLPRPLPVRRNRTVLVYHSDRDHLTKGTTFLFEHYRSRTETFSA